MTESTRSSIQIPDEAYLKLGLSKSKVEPWEDGLRTDCSRGTYEWWYFDSHLDDGSRLIIVFYTKHIIDVNKPLMPVITVQYDASDGTHYQEVLTAPVSEFSASKETCDVRIGANRFSGDLHTYKINITCKVIQAEVTLTGRVRPWRPGTGYIHFGKRDEYYFAWLPAVPEGSVESVVTAVGQTHRAKGTGYHDHNWGNVAMPRVMNHWYWGRARIGDYTVISSFITAEKKYGYSTAPVFLLAKGNEVLAENALEYLTFTASDEYIDKVTGKPVHNRLVYDYDDGRQHYRITYRREADIARTKFADTLSPLKRALAKMIGFDGAYLRFTGTATLERFSGGRVVEKVSNPALWELMFLGRTQKTL
jgi:hypothetical protein